MEAMVLPKGQDWLRKKHQDYGKDEERRQTHEQEAGRGETGRPVPVATGKDIQLQGSVQDTPS